MLLIDYICAILVRIANIIFHLLPIKFSLWLGRRIGTLVFLVNWDRRPIGYANLRAAFSREKTPGELKSLIKKVYESFAEVFCEVLSLTKIDKPYVEKYIDIVNPENMYKVDDNPNGVILLGAHFGNWELSGAISALKGYPLYVLARKQKMKKLNELIDKLRALKGLTVVRKGVTTKYIVKALHEGKMIGMVGDQDAGKNGVFVDFFGRPASTAPGSARIAAKTGAYILPAFMARLKGPYHRLTLEEPMKITEGEDIAPYLEKYNKMLEKHVRAHPEQWLWLHRKWKSTPLKKVVVLSDGKAGHLNQSLAVLKELKRFRKDAGYKESDTEVSVVEIKFRNKFARTFLKFSSLFSGKACQGCMMCLKASLTAGSCKDLMSKYADIVISAGSGLEGVNRLFSLENNAKSAIIMKPSLLGFNKFDMTVVPRHDGFKTRGDGRIIATVTVPNLVDEEYLKKSSEMISGAGKLEKTVKIGVLLGGDNSDFELTGEIAREVLNNIISASRELDADLLFTTSRRTPPAAEEAVKRALGREERCKFLVIANEKNNEHAVGGILGLSDIVVVSGESASMVSEAVFSGKAVVVVKLKKKRKKTSKFEIMLDNLKERDYVAACEAKDLSGTITRSFRAKRPKPLPEDRYDVYKYMWRLGL